MKRRAKWKPNPRRIIWRSAEQQIPVVMQFKLDGRKEEGEGDEGQKKKEKKRSGGNLISPSERRDVRRSRWRASSEAPPPHTPPPPLHPHLFSFLAASVSIVPPSSVNRHHLDTATPQILWRRKTTASHTPGPCRQLHKGENIKLNKKKNKRIAPSCHRLTDYA